MVGSEAYSKVDFHWDEATIDQAKATCDDLTILKCCCWDEIVTTFSFFLFCLGFLIFTLQCNSEGEVYVSGGLEYLLAAAPTPL